MVSFSAECPFSPAAKIRHLEYFVAAAEELNFNVAARFVDVPAQTCATMA
jgi:hypothetical protein